MLDISFLYMFRYDTTRAYARNNTHLACSQAASGIATARAHVTKHFIRIGSGVFTHVAVRLRCLCALTAIRNCTAGFATALSFASRIAFALAPFALALAMGELLANDLEQKLNWILADCAEHPLLPLVLRPHFCLRGRALALDLFLALL